MYNLRLAKSNRMRAKKVYIPLGWTILCMRRALAAAALAAAAALTPGTPEGGILAGPIGRFTWLKGWLRDMLVLAEVTVAPADDAMLP